MKLEQATIKILERISRNGDEFVKKEELVGIRIGRNKIEEVLNYLSHKNLIIYRNDAKEIRINPALGRDFINDYKKNSAQKKFNGIIAITGSIVALTAIYEFFMSFESLQNNGIIKATFIILIFLCFASIVPFVIDYWKNEVLGYE
jgi:hypothetical protein